jgi:hypothetical protein
MTVIRTLDYNHMHVGDEICFRPKFVCELFDGLVIGKEYRGHIMTKDFPWMVINIQDEDMVLKDIKLSPLSMPVNLYSLAAMLPPGEYIKRVSDEYDKKSIALEERHVQERRTLHQDYLLQIGYAK